MWDATAALVWLRRCDELVGIIMWRLIVLSGQPPRGPEVAGMTLRNTEDGARGVYLINSRTVWGVGYNKADATLVNRRVIARFADRLTSALFNIYQAVVRSLYDVVALRCACVDRVSSTAVFVRMGRPLTEDQVIDEFEKQHVCWVGVAVGWQQWRQYCTALIRRLRINIQGLPKDMWDEQAGHSTDTADWVGPLLCLGCVLLGGTACQLTFSAVPQKYGAEEGDLRGLTTVSLAHFGELSTRWQDELLPESEKLQLCSPEKPLQPPLHDLPAASTHDEAFIAAVADRWVMLLHGAQ